MPTRPTIKINTKPARRVLGMRVEVEGPVRFQMPVGLIDVTPDWRITFGPGLRPRNPDPWSHGADDRCFNVAYTRDRGRHWTRVWLGRKLWRVDRVETKGTY